MTEPRRPEEIRRDIERSREELADAIGALAAQANVRAQARKGFDAATRFAAALWDQYRLLVVAAGTALIWIVVRVRQRSV